MLEQLNPRIRAIHHEEADGPTECISVMSQDFRSLSWEAIANVPSYGEWLLATEQRPTYEYHRRVVKLLQSRRPPDLWLFKAPHHNFHLEAIASAYPDARFVMTHRDPAKSVPSWASIVSTIFPAAQGERDMQRLGREVSNHLRIGVEHAIAARARLGEDRFLDVHHPRLIADPQGTMRRIYDYLDLELRPSVEEAMLDWQRTNRSGARGTHTYTAEQFGLSTQQLRSDYDFYIRHFGVEVES